MLDMDFYDLDSAPEEMAKEVAMVGILPLAPQHKAAIGERFMIGGQPFICTGYTTSERFRQRCKEEIGDEIDVPDGQYIYHEVSTD